MKIVAAQWLNTAFIVILVNDFFTEVWSDDFWPSRTTFSGIFKFTSFTPTLPQSTGFESDFYSNTASVIYTLVISNFAVGLVSQIFMKLIYYIKRWFKVKFLVYNQRSLPPRPFLRVSGWTLLSLHHFFSLIVLLFQESEQCLRGPGVQLGGADSLGPQDLVHLFLLWQCIPMCDHCLPTPSSPHCFFFLELLMVADGVVTHFPHPSTVVYFFGLVAMYATHWLCKYHSMCRIPTHFATCFSLFTHSVCL